MNSVDALSVLKKLLMNEGCEPSVLIEAWNRLDYDDLENELANSLALEMEKHPSYCADVAIAVFLSPPVEGEDYYHFGNLLNKAISHELNTEQLESICSGLLCIFKDNDNEIRSEGVIFRELGDLLLNDSVLRVANLSGDSTFALNELLQCCEVFINSVEQNLIDGEELVTKKSDFSSAWLVPTLEVISASGKIEVKEELLNRARLLSTTVPNN